MDPRVRYIHGNSYWQVFVSKKCFITGYPIEKKGDYNRVLIKFIQDFGPPDLMLMGVSPKKTKNRDFQTTLQKNSIPSRVTEPYIPYQNEAERTIS